MTASPSEVTLFQSVIKGRNFITPYVKEYLKIENFIIEISYGDLFGSKIYGISVVEESFNGKGIRRDDLSDSAHSESEVQEKIESLKGKLQDFLKRYAS